MTTILILVAIVVMVACSAWLTICIRRKARYIVLHVNSFRTDALHQAWTVRTIDAWTDPRLIIPPPGPWTLDASAIATLARLVEQEKPGLVVELGSGLSTILTASILRKTGGRLVSIDHDATFAELTRGYLAANGLEDIVDLRVAPLAPVAGEPGALWYDPRLIADLQGIDLLFIDGPPKPVDPLIRRHALPHLAARLSPGAHVFLDDAERAGERAIMDQWRRDFPIAQMLVVGHPKAHAVMVMGERPAA
jgi:predicted O-methyltransferase YrrM